MNGIDGWPPLTGQAEGRKTEAEIIQARIENARKRRRRARLASLRAMLPRVKPALSGVRIRLRLARARGTSQVPARLGLGAQVAHLSGFHAGGW